MLMHASYEASLYRYRYQRNNKRSGLKNLRCFPCCSETHRTKGFCGRPVAVRVMRSVKDLPNTDPQLVRELLTRPLVAYAEFVKVDNEHPPVTIGAVLRRSDIEPRVRNREHAYRPWYEGTVIQRGEGMGVAECSQHFDRPDIPGFEVGKLGDGSCDTNYTVFHFNNSLKGWNYGWVANKYTCNSEHWYTAYVFIPVDDNGIDPRLQCVGVFRSPRFVLYCRKRPDVLETATPPPPPVVNAPPVAKFTESAVPPPPPPEVTKSAEDFEDEAFKLLMKNSSGSSGIPMDEA